MPSTFLNALFNENYCAQVQIPVKIASKSPTNGNLATI